MKTTAPHPELPEFYADPAARQDYVDDLFDRTADDYDAVCRVLSLGSGASYRRRALRKAGVGPGAVVLDVATGTGQVADAALAVGVAQDDLWGVDPSAGMLGANTARGRMQLVRSRGEHLPFRDRTFDWVLMGYALRHVADLETAFAEFHRVLVPGGRVLVLEITRPGSRLLRGMLKQFMLRCVPPLARLRGCGREVGELMRYYWATIDRCVAPAAVLEALRASGFEAVGRRVVGGMFSEYSARRPA
jgi:demethylmenaquinone methyltransferase/2-methoxy-6-polyprenyl-1,4-benzoquinol methylase